LAKPPSSEPTNGVPTGHSPVRDSSGIIVGNIFNKHKSRNPVARFLFGNFVRSAHELIELIPAATILEVGCGEGYMTQVISRWKPGAKVCGVDLVPQVFDPHVRAALRIRFSVQSAYDLAFASGTFDLVAGFEVLEHLATPRQALEEIRRVSRDYILLSVPHEPVWRMLNLARMAYVRDLGNTPGHINHWTTDGFVSLIAEYFKIQRVLSPLPWTIVLARKR
jgi:SAM-dependent methyltransferase